MQVRAAAASLIAGFLVIQASASQRAPNAQQAPTFRAEVNFVDVDVRVTDAGGSFVRDLRPEDFEVREDGARQTVSTFAMVDLPYEVQPRRTASTPVRRIESDVRSNARDSDGRVFVLVLDDLHTHPLRSTGVKDAARQFIDRYVGPDDLVSVLHTSGRSDASQEFTSVASLALASVDRFMGRKLRSSVLERLDAYNRESERFGRNENAPIGGRNADIRMQSVLDPLDAERGRQAEDLLKTLQRLGTLLAETRGRRKAVLLISEGVDYPVQSGSVQTDSGLQTFASPSAPAVMQRIRGAIAAMTRANVAVYGIDPRGLATTGDDTIEMGALPDNPLLGLSPTALNDELRHSQDSLRVLSDETGGFAAVNSNDFSAAFERIIQENSSYYVLGYRSDNRRTDGRFRKIEVRVRRSGMQVRARSGYYAPSSREAAANAEMLSTKAEPSEALRPLLNNALPVSGMTLRAFAAPFKGAGSNGSVLFGLEIDATNFVFGRKDGLYTDKLEAAVVALDYEGKFHQGDRHSVELTLRPETHEIVRANGIRLLFRLNLPPGRYQLRAAAHESGASARGSVHYDVEVPGFDREALSVSGLVLSSTRAAAVPTPRPDPELQALLDAPPTTSRQFAPADTLAVGFALYHDVRKPVGRIDVSTTVTGVDGQVRFRNETQVSDDVLRVARNGYGYVVKVPLAEMAPGTYVLRVQAKSALAEGTTAARELPFDIR
jgi:VWFA-related protein